MSDANQTLTISYEIPHQNLERLLNRLKKLSSRAEKLGLPPFAISQGEVIFRKKDDTSMPVAFVPVTLTAQRPIISGYRFLAKLESVPGADSNLVLSLASDQVPERYRFAPPDCNHCKVNRKRSNTYLVQHIETKEILQVGSSCLADFTGHQDPHVMASYAQLLFEADDLMGRSAGWGGDYSYDEDSDVAPQILEMKTLLAVASAVVRNEGRYESRAQNERGYGTVDMVLYVIDKNRTEILKQEDYAQADAIIQWLKSDDVRDSAVRSDFLYNLRTLAQAGAVPLRRVGLAVAAVPAYQRYLREQLEKTQAQHYLGEIDKRIELQVRFDHAVTRDGYWGTTTICSFTDMDSGGKLVWFASGSVPMRVGSIYRIAGTVVKHDEYRGVKQTTLQRVVAPDLKAFDLFEGSGDLDLKALQKALKKISDINVRNLYGETLLNHAVRSGKFEAIPILVNAGVDPNIPDDQGSLPILPLICNSHYDEVKLLVDHGARLDFEGERNDRGVLIVNPREYVDDSDADMLAAIGEYSPALRVG